MAIAFIAHHISCDHSSFERLWEQLDHCIENGAPDAIDVGYGAFSSWLETSVSRAAQMHWLSNRELSEDQGFDLQAPDVTGPDTLLETPTNLSRDVFDIVVRHTPVASTVAAAIAAMRPHARSDLVTVSLISSSRTHEKADPLIGYLLNLMPISVHCPLNLSHAALLDRVEAALSKTLPFRGYAFSQICADRRTAGLPEPRPDVLVSISRNDPVFFGGRRLNSKVLFSGHAVAPLTFFHEMHDKNPKLMLEHSGELVDKRQAHKILKAFGNALECIVANPNSPVKTDQGE
jgi:hypothetical protein